jgi:hypothetical protein
VSHFHVFGCKCFILKKGKKLDKFEARSVDGIFFGYASHSRAYRVLNLETNQIVETCEVTFNETQPRSQLVVECAGYDELGEEIFQEEEHVGHTPRVLMQGRRKSRRRTATRIPMYSY